MQTIKTKWGHTICLNFWSKKFREYSSTRWSNKNLLGWIHTYLRGWDQEFWGITWLIITLPLLNVYLLLNCNYDNLHYTVCGPVLELEQEILVEGYSVKQKGGWPSGVKKVWCIILKFISEYCIQLCWWDSYAKVPF